MPDPKRVIEAALFMSGEPIALRELAELAGLGESEALGVLGELEAEFNSLRRAFQIARLEKNKFQMRVSDELLQIVGHLGVDPEFSKAALRCLGLIAVKQPVRQSIVVKIIGNKAYDYIRDLKEKGFIEAKKQANTKILSVTGKFENYFGKRAEEIRKNAVGV
ncbi:SMC-Scp complex subunit ScpB [archaeon]|nr:SMC-Scp complex subunit ScpB [archaeon]